MLENLEHHADWIVLNNSMKVLGRWADDDAGLAEQLRPHARRLAEDERRSVARSAHELMDRLGWVPPSRDPGRFGNVAASVGSTHRIPFR